MAKPEQFQIYDTVLDFFDANDICENCEENKIGEFGGHTDDDVLLCEVCWKALFPKAFKQRKEARLRANGAAF